MSLFALGCSRHSGVSPAPVAVVRGEPISRALFEYYVQQQTGMAIDQVDPTRQASLLRNLKQLKAAAIAERGHANGDAKEALELQDIELLSHAGAVAAQVYATPSESDLRDEYNRYVMSLPAQQFHVAHILIATEAAANALILKLQGDADFATLAGEQSADDSKSRGGDLGWIAPGKLPIDFVDTVKSLTPGKIAAHPVHTIYGWHVIKLLESRPATPPPLAQVEALLTDNLQQARYKEFLGHALASDQADK